MTVDDRWFHRRGSLARDGWESVVDDSLDGWQHTGLHIAELSQGDEISLGAAGLERIVIPLAGSFVVDHSAAPTESVRTTLTGRTSVFDGPTDVLYLSGASTGRLSGEGRVAVASSPARSDGTIHPSRHIPASGVPVELRGAGTSSRQVHNFGTPESLAADRLIVCEVITPSANWSSYPPHKHDEHVEGSESELEEIYYFEAAPVRDGGRAESAHAAFGLFSAYASPAGQIEIDATVRTGDIALVPHGYHGPAVAAPGYDLYYLNVMAGPGAERSWLISDDPDHAWVRDAWNDQDVDPRLPYTSGNGDLR